MIRSFLADGQVLLFDGAMGTLYGENCERANFTDPDGVAAIHRAYIEAGANAIKTNTFGVSDWPREERESAIRAACRIAQGAAKPDTFIFADLGPSADYLSQAAVFLDCGITCFLAETLPNDDGIAELYDHLHQRGAFLIVSYAVGPDGITRDGLSGAELFHRTRADAVGFNCVSGPSHLLSYIRKLDLDGKVLSVMPNAGYPTVLGRRTVFMGTPEYFGSQMAQIAQSGAAIVGGCCGTTPEHIRAVRQALKRPASIESAISQPQRARQPQPNPLWDKIEKGRKVIAVELDPPVDDDLSFFLDGMATLRDMGADIVTIADCPVGRPRADSSLLACKVKRELGIEPLPHLTCRDRNVNATKALLLGLSMEGVHNVLLVTGDPIPTAERAEVKSVYNFNSRKLAQYVQSLNSEVLVTPFRIFGALNLNAKNFDMQLSLAQEKEASGMSGFLTQPVLSREAYDNLVRARRVLKGKILGGIFPVVSHRNALFLNNEISGMRVCDEIVALYADKTRDEAENLAVDISLQVARAIAPHVDGLYLMTPFKRVSLVSRILREISACALPGFGL